MRKNAEVCCSLRFLFGQIKYESCLFRLQLCQKHIQHPANLRKILLQQLDISLINTPSFICLPCNLIDVVRNVAHIIDERSDLLHVVVIDLPIHRNKPTEEIIRIEGGIPAIISKETWLAAQEYRMKYTARNLSAKTMYLLSEAVKCGCCNKIMYGSMRIRQNHPSFYTYVCKTKKSECSNLKEIDRDSLENYVVELILNKCLNDENSEESDKLMNTDRTSVVFRALLQQYIKEITVHKDNVIFHPYVNGKVKSYRHKRIRFKTATQRYFK